MQQTPPFNFQESEVKNNEQENRIIRRRFTAGRFRPADSGLQRSGVLMSYYFCYKCESEFTEPKDGRCPFCGNDSLDVRERKPSLLAAVFYALLSCICPQMGLEELKQ